MGASPAPPLTPPPPLPLDDGSVATHASGANASCAGERPAGRSTTAPARALPTAAAEEEEEEEGGGASHPAERTRATRGAGGATRAELEPAPVAFPGGGDCARSRSSTRAAASAAPGAPAARGGKGKDGAAPATDEPLKADFAVAAAAAANDDEDEDVGALDGAPPAGPSFLLLSPIRTESIMLRGLFEAALPPPAPPPPAAVEAERWRSPAPSAAPPPSSSP